MGQATRYDGLDERRNAPDCVHPVDETPVLKIRLAGLNPDRWRGSSRGQGCRKHRSRNVNIAIPTPASQRQLSDDFLSDSATKEPNLRGARPAATAAEDQRRLANVFAEMPRERGLIVEATRPSDFCDSSVRLSSASLAAWTRVRTMALRGVLYGWQRDGSRIRLSAQTKHALSEGSYSPSVSRRLRMASISSNARWRTMPSGNENAHAAAASTSRRAHWCSTEIAASVCLWPGVISSETMRAAAAGSDCEPAKAIRASSRSRDSPGGCCNTHSCEAWRSCVAHCATRFSSRPGQVSDARVLIAKLTAARGSRSASSRQRRSNVSSPGDSTVSFGGGSSARCCSSEGPGRFSETEFACGAMARSAPGPLD